MKACFFSVFALAAGAFANPVAVAPRDASVSVSASASASVTLGNLVDTIKTCTGSINSTMSAYASVTLSVDEQNDVLEKILPEFESITAILQVAIKGVGSTDFLAGLSATSDIREAIECASSEVLYTMVGVIGKIGLCSPLLTCLQLVLVTLGGLIRTVVEVLSGLDDLVTDVESMMGCVLGSFNVMLGAKVEVLGSATGLLGLFGSVLS